MQIITEEITHFHLFCGLGGGAKGFNEADARVGNIKAKFTCIGGIDVDAAAIRDFGRLTGVPGTVMDLFSVEQYEAFHGQLPPPGWQESTPADIQRAAGYRKPNIVFLSAPCKGFSGLLSEGKSKTEKYQALNALTLRGMWLALEAWKDDPVELFVFENVPRIANRGRHLLDQIVALLRSYGFAVAETTHDCGEIGGLAQSRKRFLLVARHIEKVPPFLYEPEKKDLRPVGDILGRMPVPVGDVGGPMHRVPRLQWKTWVRLAFVEAGSDWRSLNRLRVEDGKLADYLIVPEGRNNGFLGVQGWNEPSGTVAGRSYPHNGNFSIADPRFEHSAKWTDGQAFGVRKWDEPTGTVTSKNVPGQGPYSVADPRVNSDRHGPFGVCPWAGNARTVAGETLPSNGNFSVADPRHHGPAKHSNEFRIVPFDSPAAAVTSAHGSGQCVADPRGGLNNDSGKYKITEWNGSTGTVIAGDDHGAYGVADPRPNWEKRYGNLQVIPWDKHSPVVHGGGKGVQGGGLSVADPRLPAPTDNLVAVIRALDGTWHRPFTTLELAALQSLIEPEEFLELDGMSDSAWRERIGNAVPAKAARAIGGVMGTTILLARTGHTFMLSNTPIWVRPVAVALSVKQQEIS